MKASIKAGALASALGLFSGAPRSSVPVLGYARIDASARTIVTTDMERAVTIPIEIDGSGVVLLPIDQARGFASNMAPDAIITIDMADGSAKLTCGRNRATLATLDPNDFPAMLEGEMPVSFVVDGATFSAMLGRVDGFASSEPTRSHLCGVYLDASRGTMSVTATDAKALATYSMTIEGHAECEAIIPTATVAVIKKIATGQMTILVSPSTVSFSTARASVLSKIVDGQYPPYRNLLVDDGARVEFKAEAMRKAIGMIDASSDGSRKFVKLTIGPAEIGIASGDGNCRAETTIPCAADVPDDFIWGTSYSCLLAAIKGVSDSVVVLLPKDANGNIGLFDGEDGNYRAVISAALV